MKRYQFALLRYVHSVSLGEAVNVGIVMWVHDDRQVLSFLNERYGRLANMYHDAFDGISYRTMIRGLRSRTESVSLALASVPLPPIPAPQGTLVLKSELAPAATEAGARPAVAEVRRLGDVLDLVLPANSSCFQWSKPMAGMTPDPADRFVKLRAEFIERFETRTQAGGREEADIWSGVTKKLRERGLAGKVRTNVELAGAHFSYAFRMAWPNGTLNVLEPITFDYLDPKSITDRAAIWAGRLGDLQKRRDFAMTAVVAPPLRRPDLMETYRRAVARIEDAPNVKAVVPEEQIDSLMEVVEHDIQAHGQH